MRVKTLIKKLEKMPENAEVKIGHFTGEEVLYVLKRKNNNEIVWLETESDNNMKEEIEAAFNHALEDNIDELDFYMELLEIGINTEMVRKYMDDEHANHMNQFCKEHGLI